MVFPFSLLMTMSKSDTRHPYDGLAHCDTNNETKFYPWEKADGEFWDVGEKWKDPDQFRYSTKREMWTYLEELHRGVRNGKWTNDLYYTRTDNNAVIENVAYQMGLTESETISAIAAFFDLHNRLIKGERKDVTAVAVCAFVAEQNGRDFHPQKLEDEGAPLAEEFAAMFACEPHEVIKRYGKVQHHLRRGISHRSRVAAAKSHDSYEDVYEGLVTQPVWEGEGVY